MKRKITWFIMVFAGILFFSLSSYESRGKAAEDNYAYFTIEKFVLGQGYILEPTKIRIGDDENVSSVLKRLADNEGIPLMSRPTKYGLYLYGIKNADSGQYDIPSVIIKYFYNDLKEYLLDGNPVNEVGADLEEIGLTPFSGWLYFVNDEWQFTGMDSRYLAPNEVVRLKYTIAAGDSGWGMNGSEQISFPDESNLIRILAELKERIKQQPDNDLKGIYDDAVSIISDLDTSVLNVDRLTDYMNGLNQAVLDNDRDKINVIRNNIEDLLIIVKANDVTQKINLIPETLTSDTMFTVRNARKAYDALDNRAITYISDLSYNNLISGEEKLSQLEEELRQQKLQAEAKKVTDKINAIGTVNLDKEAIITEARQAYETLNPEAQSMVSSGTVDLLRKAEASLAQLKKEKSEKEEADKKAASQAATKINAIGKVTLDKESTIIEARKAYNALNADAKKLVASSAVSKLTSAEKQIARLKEEAALKKKYTPKKAVFKSVEPARKKVKLTWKKIAKASGYQIFMSKKKASGYKKIATIKKTKTVTFTKKKLKSKKTYYFRVRAYKTVGKKTYYGAYSSIKKAKVK